MLQTRKDTQELERGRLAPYAVKCDATRGRRSPELPHAYRTEFQRDRDRILHSRCYRRLEYKTQVFVNGTADHYRTRLTHTLEMTAVGRTLARALNVNEDLTECIALAHDIGHSPFGHAGEETLNELMRDHGGFDHNLQSVRWVEYLEQRYPEFDGLNLTWEVRAGLRKHLADQPGAQLDGWPIGPRQHLEAQIADIADDIAYHAHDVDDGLEAGLLTMDQLRELELWRRAERRVASSYTALASHHHRALTVRNLLDLQVEDILHHSAALLERVSPADPDEVMRCSERLVTFGDEMAEIQQTTRDFLFRHMYGHPEVAGANQESARLMVRLFQHYVSHPETLGGKARERLVQDGVWRTVCDYVSGMTDRYALKECAAYGLDGHAGQESDEP